MAKALPTRVIHDERLLCHSYSDSLVYSIGLQEWNLQCTLYLDPILSNTFPFYQTFPVEYESSVAL
jgi:hypothetical protein